MSHFAHLHNHSDYSLLDGACRISDYIKRAKELGMKHVGLTDHGNMFGALHFERACHKEGINPVVGCEVYVAPGNRFTKPTSGPKNYHMVLYVKNEVGYQNLMRLTTRGYQEGFYYRPRIDDELLEEYHEGLMASSACLAGEIPRAIVAGEWEKAYSKALYYRNLFGEGNYWLEIMNHGIPEEEIVRKGMRRLSEETGIPIIATNDVHFLSKAHANAHDIFICISTGKKQADEKRLKTENPEFYFKSEEEMRALFPDFPDAIENTIKLAEKCKLKIPQPGPQLPEYQIPEGFPNPQVYLRHLTNEGLKKRYPAEYFNNEKTYTWEDIQTRCDYELKVLFEMGYEGYFLIVWDFIDWARKQDIPVGPGRGSGAGSIVAYALKITDIDPLKYNLLFERFLNPERISMPDFDIDFCNERRNEVIEYVHSKYGEEHVAGICTFGTLKTKAVLKDVSRVLDIPFAETNAITKLIPYVIQGEDKAEGEELPEEDKKVTVQKALSINQELQAFRDRGGVYTELFEVASVLEGMNRHLSTHACGQVIGKTHLTDYVPLVKDQKTGDMVTAYTMDIIESCGLVKMDFLSLKTLTLLKDCENLIRIHSPDFDLEKIPEDDNNTFEMLGKGRSEGVFQFESQGMQKVLRDAKPSNVEDLIALNALYRPGPMQYIKQFTDSKLGHQRIAYPHPHLEETLKPTYGVIVYQEQVMKVAQIIGGFSLGKADILRRAMGKKKMKEMERMKQEFIQGAKKKGYTSKLAKDIFEMLKPFAKYGFNKSHAAAYSLVAYKTAYCKANHPAEFWAANLTNEIDNPDNLKHYLGYTRADDIQILPPDINLSGKKFTVSNGNIIYGLKGIKGMGEAATDAIIEARTKEGSFTNFQDFLRKVNLKAINRKTLEVSIQAGLFDSIETHNRATLLCNFEELLGAATKKQKEEDLGQISLFEDMDEEVEIRHNWKIEEGWSDKEKLQKEKDILGVYVSGHPMDAYADIWKKTVSLNLGNLQDVKTERMYSFLGILKEVNIFYTRKGKKLGTAKLEDFNGTIDILAFSQTLETSEHLFTEDSIVAIKGSVDPKDTPPKIKIKEIFKPDKIIESIKPNIHIKFKNEGFDRANLIDFRTFLQDFPGSGNLFLHVPEGDGYTIIKATEQLKLSADNPVIEQLKKNELVADVWKE